MSNFPISEKVFLDFLSQASANTYAGGGKYEEHPERAGFKELVWQEGDLHYRDSYTGFYRSVGTEVISLKGVPIYVVNYGGGMMDGYQNMAGETFAYLKKALLQDVEGFCWRGPKTFIDGDWSYSYKQTGGIDYFQGHEEIWFQGQQVFWHDVQGIGVVHQEV